MTITQTFLSMEVRLFISNEPLTMESAVDVLIQDHRARTFTAAVEGEDVSVGITGICTSVCAGPCVVPKLSKRSII